MSHSAVISLANKFNDELIICNRLNEKILELKSNITVGETLKKDLDNSHNEVQKVINKINELHKQELRGDSDHLNQDVLNIQLKIDREAKRIENLFSNLDFIKNVLETTKFNNQEINNLIKENGYIARIAIQQIRANEEIVNEENIIKQMQNIKTLDSIEQEKEKFLNEVGSRVGNSNFDEAIKEYLYELSLNLNSAQEYSDFFAYVFSKENNLLKIKTIFKEELLSSFESSGLTLLSETEEIVDKKIKVKYTFRDGLTGEISVYFSENMTLDYQMGNYEGHMCFKKSEEFLDKINKNRKILSNQIYRDISNSKEVLYKTKRRGE